MAVVRQSTAPTQLGGNTTTRRYALVPFTAATKIHVRHHIPKASPSPCYSNKQSGRVLIASILQHTLRQKQSRPCSIPLCGRWALDDIGQYYCNGIHNRARPRLFCLRQRTSSYAVETRPGLHSSLHRGIEGKGRMRDMTVARGS